MSEKIKNIMIIALTSIFLFGFTAWSIFEPDGDASVSERRPLEQLPKVSGETVKTGEFMSSFESYALDQFPLRDGFRTVKSIASLYVLRQKDNNKIFVKDGYASKLEYPIDHASLEHASSRFRFVYDSFLKDSGARVYLSVIPDKSYFIAEQNGYPSFDYGEFIAEMRDSMEYAEYIDILDLLELSDYYKTDTHWRQEKIVDVAARLASAMGVELSAEYTAIKTETPFYGVYFGQSALPLPAEDISYIRADYFDKIRVFDHETNKYIPIYDFDKLNDKDPYEMFLSGSKSLLTIENTGAPSDRVLICFRDSFGSSIAPILAEGYGRVIVVDIRYISPMMLGRFISFEGSDVLFLYSTSVLNNSITIK